MEKVKEIWYEVNDNAEIAHIDKVFNLDYSTILIPFGNIAILHDLKLPQRMRIALSIDTASELAAIDEIDVSLRERLSCVISRHAELLEKAKDTGNFETGILISVNNRESLDNAISLLPKTDLLIIEFSDPTNIPLELVLARNQSGTARVFKKVKHAGDGEVSMLTMEVGCDGILLDSKDINEIVKLNDIQQRATTEHLELKESIVTNVKHAGMGTRVCIDTTTELLQDEGMILGSTSSGGILTCSETHYLPYMNLRPFRVNAGGLHLYIWGPNNEAFYLSDLRAGDKVFAVNSKGQARIVTVGRLKVESRPMLYVEAEIENQKVSTFIQDDWHVRLFGSQGEIRPSSEIRPGDKLLGYLDTPGRHVGIKINETIKEV